MQIIVANLLARRSFFLLSTVPTCNAYSLFFSDLFIRPFSQTSTRFYTRYRTTLFVAEYVGRSLRRFTRLSLLLAFQVNGNAIRQTRHSVTGIDRGGPLRQWRSSRSESLINTGTPTERSINCGTDREQNELNSRSIQKVLLVLSAPGFSREAIPTCFERVNHEQRMINPNTSRKPRCFPRSCVTRVRAPSEKSRFLLSSSLSAPSAIVETGRSAKSGQIRSV